tara:strand:- start:2230 stop:4260 length:2031 start_codon:yes stop_codon:yes gene_type:complete
MSYRHPRFYKEDYTGFNKGASAAFQQSFTDVKGYFDKKIEQRKEYEADLHAQADKMREAAAASGQVGAEFQKKLEENIQNFLKEGMAVDGMDKPGFFFQNVKETGKKDKLDLDKANANFNAEIAAANNITDRAFVAGLEIDEDYDHGSGSYLEYASVVKALQSNFKEGGNVDFKYKGEGSNEFGFGVTINNPRWRPGDPEEEKMITYSAQDVQRLIGENDPKARAQIEENINTAVDSLVKTAKSDLDERFASGRASGKDGVLYKGETSVENTVAQYMREMRQQDENNPDDPSIIDDIFNNKVKFNDNIRLQELERVEGSAGLIGLANNEDNAEKLAMLLDMPHNELSYSKKILNEMGVKDVDGALKTLEAAKNNMVERYLKNEVMGSGIASKYIDPKAPEKPKGPPTKPPKVDNYAIQQGSRTMETINETQSAIERAAEVLPGVLDGTYEGGSLITAALAQDPSVQLTDFKESMTGQTFKYGGTNVPVKDFDIDKDGNMIFTFERGSATEDEVDEDGNKTGRKTRVDFQKDSETFNIYDPEDMRGFYKAISPEMGGSTEYSRNFSSIAFDENMVENFINSDDFISKISNPKYEKWVDWVSKRTKKVSNKDGDLVTSYYGREEIINKIANDPAIINHIDPNDKENYKPALAKVYNKFKSEIDSREIDRLMSVRGFGN